LIDEPSVGLAPVLVKRTIEKIKELNELYKLTLLMAEQNFNQRSAPPITANSCANSIWGDDADGT
jgi:ABC-type branched-subunit amino acid transport system ATPase component